MAKKPPRFHATNLPYFFKFPGVFSRCVVLLFFASGLPFSALSQKSREICPKAARKRKKKAHDQRHFKRLIVGFFGALEGTRIPGPLIKSQMLYRLSYERIFCGKTIPPNNITTIGCKKQERRLKKRKFQFYTTRSLKKLLRPVLQQLHQQTGIDADH